MKTDQITAVHYARGAYVYIRQSSTHPVLPHTENQQRQRALETLQGDVEANLNALEQP